MTAEKIISEKINTQFQEIEEDEDDEEEESLEEELEDEPTNTIEDDSFVDFTTETVIPTLQASETQDTTPEPLEEELEDVPTTPAIGGPDADYEVSNMPYDADYAQANYENMNQEEIKTRDREMNITHMTPRVESTDTERKMDFGAFSGEMQHPETRRITKDYTMKIGRQGDDAGLPFEERKKKGRLNI
tara:strand:+ start:2508 stop:3074 length:567 start_codon:yes stop_codon:yes gene_type:complete